MHIVIGGGEVFSRSDQSATVSFLAAFAPVDVWIGGQIGTPAILAVSGRRGKGRRSFRAPASLTVVGDPNEKQCCHGRMWPCFPD
ncbi:hypothetical protein PDE_02576 [Penicillium oxalicum 114-2]|uniref:Uncharacterized protein n=1 Tax=Penicillium oxalicum (strain 114-2 / CGMCC 5302) TaxID=933388 RepID=S8B012_PENO1|nr:hypothetical protein PDE_02576 [Penicillium oxalicum 114-2]